MWGFWERQIWIRNTALWGKDWSIKPSGQAFVDLMSRDWTTSETAATGADGVATIRGFLGEYALSVRVGDAPPIQTGTSLSRQGGETVVRLPAP
ncbi:MAG: hypothetical protein HON70_47600 [Lentisphaerae bacterium]|jgi:endo-1,4-beta-xylanase|nr:hypothetical protein [Lentisphaerota bacterium]